MPELAEVEIARLKILPAVKGRRILDFWTDWPRALRTAASKQHAASSMRGRKIINVRRRGKVLFLDLSGKPEKVVAIHLRMSGRLEIAPSKSPAARWAHFVWRLSGGKKLVFVDPRKFGTVWYGAKDELARDRYLGRLGLDARGLAEKTFVRALRERTGMIKPLLLRQDVFAGIGNIIADESLWFAKIHPTARVTDLSRAELVKLHRSLAKTIAAMLSAGGTSLRNWGHPDGKAGGYQNQRKIYGKAGKPCPRCGVKLERIVVGGRGTTICPKCQKL